MAAKKQLIILPVLLILLALPEAALPRAPVLESLNAQRAAHGIPAGITENPDWSQGCAAHVNYMKVNNYFGHDEDPAKPAYSEAGDKAGNSSVLNHGGWSRVDENPFEFAPIHLAQLLAPALSVTGFDDDGLCIHTWPGYQRPSPATISFYSYPANGTTNWRYQEWTGESPFSPAEALGLANPTGSHVYLYPFGVGSNFLRVKTITLSGPEGVVDSRFVARNDGSKVAPYLPMGAILIPVKPLQPLSRYTVVSQWETRAPSVVFSEQERFDDVQRIWGLFTLSTPELASELAQYNAKTSADKYWYWSELVVACDKAAGGTIPSRPFNKTLPANTLCRTVKTLTDERAFTTGEAKKQESSDSGDDQNNNNSDSEEITAVNFAARGKGRSLLIKMAAHQGFRGQEVGLSLAFARGAKTRKVKRVVTLEADGRLRVRSPFASGHVRLTITGKVDGNELYPTQQLRYRYKWRVR